MYRFEKVGNSKGIWLDQKLGIPTRTQQTLLFWDLRSFYWTRCVLYAVISSAIIQYTYSTNIFRLNFRFQIHWPQPRRIFILRKINAETARGKHATCPAIWLLQRKYWYMANIGFFLRQKNVSAHSLKMGTYKKGDSKGHNVR